MERNEATQSDAWTKEVSFGELLRMELTRRCKDNSRYSLRAFAIHLGVSPSSLSRVIAGTRAPSKDFINKASASLRLSPRIALGYLDPETVSRKIANSRQKDSLKLQAEWFELLSDWTHHVIFELIETHDFKYDHKWIARRLGVSRFHVKEAIERLTTLGLIEIQSGKVVKIQKDISTSKVEHSATPLRKLQRQYLEMASVVMDEVPIDLRSQTTMTMAINLSKIPAAKQKINQFRYEMMAFLQSDGPLEDVYNLTVSFYPTTKIRKGENQ